MEIEVDTEFIVAVLGRPIFKSKVETESSDEHESSSSHREDYYQIQIRNMYSVVVWIDICMD